MELEGVELDRIVRKALQISVKTVGHAVSEEELARLRDEAKDLRWAIELRDEIIDGLKAEVERLRVFERAQMNADKMHNYAEMRVEEDEAKIRGASMAIKDIREKYPSGKMTVEENHGD